MQDFYKYQNVRINEEYQELLKNQIQSQEYQGKVIEIPIFRNCEFDIKCLSENYNSIANAIYENEESDGVIDVSLLKASLWEYLHYSQASYLAPAYNYNCYINLLIELNISHMNHEKNNKMMYKDYYYTILIQNLLISIRSLLDKMVPIFSFYYGGISLNTTFGSLLNLLEEYGKKHDDLLVKFILEENDIWIKEIVEPRNTIIHYNDLYSTPRFTIDDREFPMHHNRKIFEKTSEERTFDYDDGFYYKSLMKSVQHMYCFYDEVMGELKSRKIVYRKSHFQDSKEYENYKNKISAIKNEM